MTPMTPEEIVDLRQIVFSMRLREVDVLDPLHKQLLEKDL